MVSFIKKAMMKHQKEEKVMAIGGPIKEVQTEQRGYVVAKK
jgi:hypothetical protein